jgi:hypothetical protein
MRAASSHLLDEARGLKRHLYAELKQVETESRSMQGCCATLFTLFSALSGWLELSSCASCFILFSCLFNPSMWASEWSASMLPLPLASVSEDSGRSVTGRLRTFGRPRGLPEDSRTSYPGPLVAGPLFKTAAALNAGCCVFFLDSLSFRGLLSRSFEPAPCMCECACVRSCGCKCVYVCNTFQTKPQYKDANMHYT